MVHVQGKDSPYLLYIGLLSQSLEMFKKRVDVVLWDVVQWAVLGVSGWLDWSSLPASMIL